MMVEVCCGQIELVASARSRVASGSSLSRLTIASAMTSIRTAGLPKPKAREYGLDHLDDQPSRSQVGDASSEDIAALQFLEGFPHMLC